MAEYDLVTVYASDNDTEAHLYRAMLEEAGIPVVLQVTPDMWGQRTAWVGPALARVRLDVRAEDAREAIELIEAFRREADSGELAREAEEDAGEE